MTSGMVQEITQLDQAEALSQVFRPDGSLNAPCVGVLALMLDPAEREEWYRHTVLYLQGLIENGQSREEIGARLQEEFRTEFSHEYRQVFANDLSEGRYSGALKSERESRSRDPRNPSRRP